MIYHSGPLTVQLLTRRIFPQFHGTSLLTVLLVILTFPFQGRAEVVSCGTAESSPRSIFGRVGGQGVGALVNASIDVCPASGGECHTGLTDGGGFYGLSLLPIGVYHLTIRPPVTSPASQFIPTHLNDVVIDNDDTCIDQDFVLEDPDFNAACATIIPTRDNFGVPVVYWGDNLTLTSCGCTGGTGSYEILLGGAKIRSGNMTAAPPGTYTASLEKFAPDSHGYAEVIITIENCPNPADNTSPSFNIYIDPSGTVQTVDGIPIKDATTTLLYASSENGPFTIVPDESGLMSPATRHNPITTDAAGHFGWDVSEGFYKVRAEKAGCVSPSNPAQSFVESAVLKIPPPKTDLVLQLSCASDKVEPVITISATPAILWPPNGKMVPVAIAGTITDIGSGVNAGTATYAVTDEYGSVQPSGKIALGANGSYSFKISLQASRHGKDKDGRRYTIIVSAQDNAGNRGSASTAVTVPHDRGR